jgi:NADPH-dependent 2,4-dienoyl-CoA reductase/sulfur reductase-like enzyme
MLERDLIIIGGGSAGMAAAIQAYKEGIKDILIIEKDDILGGILNQCIHNGFGLSEFKEELTGPEYSARFIDEINKLPIEVKLNTTVTRLTRDLVVDFSNEVDGFVTLKAKAIVFATGCYERNAGAIQIPGDRPSGIITAGLAQKYLNIEGYLVGKKVLILGSGDIGLIMARRLTLEGAEVLGVVELMPYSNGLERNIVQCLEDFNIPLFLSHTVSKINGKSRVESVEISKVDEKFNFIPGSEKVFDCDTLLLSIGLIPNVNLLSDIKCPIGATKGAIVDEKMETMIPGIFTCGNCLHVHDLVDFVSEEGRLAGHGAAFYIKNGSKKDDKLLKTIPGENISYIVPSRIEINPKEDVTLKFRVLNPLKDAHIICESNGKILKKKFSLGLVPSEMITLKLSKDILSEIKNNITVRAESSEVTK